MLETQHQLDQLRLRKPLEFLPIHRQDESQTRRLGKGVGSYLSGNWTIPDLTTGVDGYLRADYSWQSAKYSTSLVGQNQGVIALANVRAGLKRDGYELSIWAKNLFDRKYVSRATVVASTADGAPISGVSSTRVYPGERRTWGVDISASF